VALLVIWGTGWLSRLVRELSGSVGYLGNWVAQSVSWSTEWLCWLFGELGGSVG